MTPLAKSCSREEEIECEQQYNHNHNRDVVPTVETGRAIVSSGHLMLLEIQRRRRQCLIDAFEEEVEREDVEPGNIGGRS